MRKRRPPGGPIADDQVAPASEPQATTASSFDAAQDLLQAALEEIRSPDARREATAPASPSPGATANDDREWRPPALTEPTDAVEFWSAAPVPRPAPVAPAAPVAPPAAAAPATAATASAPTQSEGTRRRRRPTAAAGMAGAAAVEDVSPEADEFADLTETMYRRPGRDARARRRRGRRPAATAAAGAAAAETNAIESDLPPGSWHLEPAEPSAADEPDDATLVIAALATGSTTTDRAPDGADRVEEIEQIEEIEQTAAEPVGEVVDETDHDDETDLTLVTAGAVATEASATGPRAGGSRRRIAQIVAVAAIVLVGVVALGVVLLGGGSSSSNKSALRTPPAAKLTIGPLPTPEGATVTRTWELQGKKGTEFTGTLAFANPTSTPKQVSFTETIPKAIAPNASALTFTPQPIIVQADPVVRYQLTVPAGGTTTATYTAKVAPDGATRARLEAWAKDLPPTPTTTTTTTATAAPTTAAPTTPPTTTGRPTTPTTGTPVTVPPTEPPPPTTQPPAQSTIGIQVYVPKPVVGTFGYSTPVGDISLVTTPDGSGNATASWSTSIEPGTYTLTQTSTAPLFHLSGIQCSNGVNVKGPSVTITVQPGESVTCTFINPPN